jgi:hypothetical protein
LSEQVKQDIGVLPVQMPEKTGEKARKRRSQEDKIGRQKYHEVVTKRTLVLEEQILAELRWVRHKLDRMGEAEYSSGDVEGFAVLDEVDREIVQRVREAGSPGVLPKDVAADVNRRGAHGLRYYEVSRRIVRMNRRLHFETGKCVFEKRGHRWALTRFAFEVWGETEKGMKNNAGDISS